MPLILINSPFLKPRIASFLLNIFKSKINGELIVNNPHYHFHRSRLTLHADKISIKQNKEAIVAVEDFDLAYPWKNFFQSDKTIDKIQAKKLYIKAIKSKDGWNLETILKPSKKEVEFIFKSLSFHDTDLEIISDGRLVEKENVFIDIHKEQAKQLYNIEFYNKKNLKDVDDEHLNLVADNKFYISGDYDLETAQGPYRYVQNLTVVLHRLKPDLINLIARGFSDRKSKFLRTFNIYSNPETSLSMKIKEITNLVDSYELSASLENFANDAHFDLHADLDLAKDVALRDLELNFFDSVLKADGVLKDAFSKNPQFDFMIDLENFNPYQMRETFVELQEIVPQNVVNLVASVHKHTVFNPVVALTGHFDSPEIDFNMPIKNNYTKASSNKKDFRLNLKFHDDTIFVKEILVPFEFADLSLNGSISSPKDFDLNLRTKDFPMRSIKPILMNVLEPEITKKIDQVVLKGYLKTDLEIKQNEKLSNPEFYGDIVLVDSSVLEPNIPILFEKINTKLNVQKDTIQVKDFAGYLYENKVDLNGFYNIYSNGYKLNLSAKNFDLGKIEGYEIKKYFNKAQNFENISGFVDDLQFNYDNSSTDFSISGIFKDLAFDYGNNGKAMRCDNLNAAFAYADNSLEVGDMKAHINKTALIEFDGSFDFKEQTGAFISTARNLPFAFLSILPNTLPVHAKDGVINFDLEFNDNKYVGKGDFKALVFDLDHEKLPENFRSANGEFAIGKDLVFNGLSTFYGNSQIKAEKFEIKNFLEEDKFYDIKIDSELKVSEFVDFIPLSIKDLLDLEGYLPLKAYARGDKQKFDLDLEGNFDKLEKLDFAQWFSYDPKVKGEFKSKFSFTPKLILSKNTSIVLTDPKKASSTEITTDFEVHDWKSKDEIRYSIDAYTPRDVNGDYLPIDLDLIEPHILSIEALNLDPGSGTMQCRTDGSYDSRHSFCDITFLDKAIAKNFGVGNLSSERANVHLISVKDLPVYIKVELFKGLWDILEYTRVFFDMEVTEDFMNIDRIRAKVGEGVIRSNLSFDFNTLASKFNIKGNNVDAHQIAESFFDLGHEVPQGIVSGQFEGSTKGLLPDDMFFNLEGEASVLVRHGKLSSLKTMQRLLSAINTLKNFDFNNVFQTLITYEGGLFNDVVSQLSFNKGKIDTEKFLLHSNQIELHLEGFVDYAKDDLMVRGLGAVPERSKSFLQLLGVKHFNVGNLLSIINLRNPGSKDKDYFAFKMAGPVYDLDKATQSLRQNFTWLRSYGGKG